jgi:rhodanese-related sulfurtransferase
MREIHADQLDQVLAGGTQLAAGGFDAVNVAGGTSGWARSGRPLEGGR